MRRSARSSRTRCARSYQKLLPTLHENIHCILALEILINAVARKYILEGREGELHEVIKSVEAQKGGTIDFNGSLVVGGAEYIHVRTAMEADLHRRTHMRLKGIG